uniref:Uncharacterized protein n=1 Tax=Lepeophtheirus salmonis TaxID=72036 RepID=A0A0K2V9K5_LEPSM
MIILYFLKFNHIHNLKTYIHSPLSITIMFFRTKDEELKGDINWTDFVLYFCKNMIHTNVIHKICMCNYP